MIAKSGIGIQRKNAHNSSRKCGSDFSNMIMDGMRSISRLASARVGKGVGHDENDVVSPHTIHYRPKSTLGWQLENKSVQT